MNPAIDLVPGLFQMNLNSMFVRDMRQIDHAIEGLYKYLQEEHDITHSVLQNMIAVLKSRTPRGKIYSRKDLENILKRDSKNLNVLADLEYLCRKSNRLSEADMYNKSIKRIMSSTEASDIRCKAICMMEQGYANLYEEAANIENISFNHQSEVYSMMLSEYKKASGNRRDYLQRCLYHTKESNDCLQESMKCKRQNEVFVRKEISINQFVKAKDMDPSIENNLFWMYYIGIAWHRHLDSLDHLTKEDKNSRIDEKANTLKQALPIFWKIIKNLKFPPRINIIYIARTKALVGHILCKHDYLIDNIETELSLIKDKKFQSYRKNPMLLLERAYDLNDCDDFVLNRYGRCLWYMADKRQCPIAAERRQLLQKSEKILSKSIKLEGRINWFAYSTRMTVRHDLALIYLHQNNKQQCLKMLNLALGDGEHLFITKCTDKDMHLLGKICQYLAKFPNIFKNGSEIVNNRFRDYLLDALDYLHFGIQLVGQNNYFLTYQMGSCLFDLNELEPAVVWMKRAWLLSYPTKNHAFTQMCLYLFRMYFEKIKVEKTTNYILEEIMGVLSDGNMKYGKLTDVYDYLIKHGSVYFLTGLTNIASIPHLLSKNGIILLEECVQYCLSETTVIASCPLKEGFCRVNDEIQNIVPYQDIKIDFNDEYQPSITSLPVSQEIHASGDFKYDFFVSYSSKDREWVIRRLLPDLEKSFTDDDVILKGCIADRDFVSGKLIFENIEHCMQNSNKVILVLSKDFVESSWCQIEMDKALIKSIGDKKSFIIPVLIEDCKIPEMLKSITYSDCTKEESVHDEIMKIRRAILPGDKAKNEESDSDHE